MVRSLPKFRVSTVADVSSAKHVTCETELHRNNFFALSGYAFKTEVADQQDGYTVLCHANGTYGKDESAISLENKKPKAVCQSQEYVLWELTCQ